MEEINELQTNIMLVMKRWADLQNIPIPQQEIIKRLQEMRVKSYTTLNAINSLIEKGWIRKACMEQRNRTYYVMCRTI